MYGEKLKIEKRDKMPIDMLEVHSAQSNQLVNMHKSRIPILFIRITIHILKSLLQNEPESFLCTQGCLLFVNTCWKMSNFEKL